MSFPTEEKGPAPNDRKHLRSGNLYPPGSLLYNGRAARYTSARGVTGNNNQIRFGVFEVRRETRELRKHGVRIKLEDQPFELLMALLEKPGDIVTRSELRARLWPEGTFVDFDKSLTKAVNKIRTALGDSPVNPRFVETLSGRGYRFIAPVDAVTGLAPNAGPGSSPSLPPVAAPKRRAWLKWAAPAASVAAMGAALLWFSRPLPPPRVTGTVQITNDGRLNGAPMLTDGTRLLFNLASDEPRQVSVKGGESTPAVVADAERLVGGHFSRPNRIPHVLASPF
jgi:DNA-binding winged helix-turn-helix (wHTH) protein